MHTTDLLEAAQRASLCYHSGSDATKLNLRECMADLRAAINAEMKRRSSEDTTRLTKEKS